MIYANDEIFQIRYNTNLNRLQMRRESWTSKVVKKIRRHKFMSTVLVTLVTFSTINVIMIYNFMKILQNI